MSPISRNLLLRTLLCGTIGPPVGLLAVLWFMQDLSESLNDPIEWARGFMAGLPMAYVVGSIPALLTGGLLAALAMQKPRLVSSSWVRCALGTLAGAAFSYLITVMYFGFDVDVTLVAGSVAGLLCGFVVNRGDSGKDGETSRI